MKKNLIDWCNKHPVDIWWRRKYKTPFGSKSHREMNFISMAFDFLEHSIISYQEYLKDLEKKGINPDEVMSDKEIDDAFNDLDIENFE